MEKSERRLDSRYMCAELARVEWVRGEDDIVTAEAVLEDISTHGVCVQVEEPIPLGATVAVSARGARFDGTVTYCVFRDYGYFMGVRLAEHSQWSPREFEPSHLTNLVAIGIAEQSDAGDAVQ